MKNCENIITLEEFDKICRKNCRIIDLRDAVLFEYGKIIGAANVAFNEVDTFLEKLPDKNLKLIFYCEDGKRSSIVSDEFSKKGYNTCFLEGGYNAWMRRKIDLQSACDTFAICEKAEKSIQKKFRKQLFSKFAFAINEYKLLEENDRVCVCISGGKDSMLMAKLFQELKKHNKYYFELVFLVMDPGYSEKNRKMIEHNAKILGIPITFFETDIFDSVFNIEKSPCYICARMRRGCLYSKAKQLGCNKIALGHHFDDVIETILMGMLYSGQTQTMMPKLKSTNFENMELIRPMYLIREDDIKAWRDYNELYFIQCACRFTENSALEAQNGESRTSSKRLETKNIIKMLKQSNPFVENNIFRSMENVNLETVIAYKDKDGVHNFLDNY